MLLIELKNLTHIYEQNQVIKALDNINLTIAKNEFIGLVGHTGSGKSTLVQTLNGLIKPTQGQVIVTGENICSSKKINIKEIRQKIGLVFQYPEHQLFEETIYEDIAFGPRNLNLPEEEVKQRVEEALTLVGLDFSTFKERSPLNISGGQKRRVAIAGVLAIRPEVLILDEPSAGLDPGGRRQLAQLLISLHQDHNLTIILVSHHMDEIANLATRILVLSQGKLLLDGSPQEIFRQVDKIRNHDLDLPQISEIMYKLAKRGLKVRTDIFTIPEAVEEISKVIKEKK